MMIDCDIHHVITDHAQLLEFVEPGQREWFPTRPSLGLYGARAEDGRVLRGAVRRTSPRAT